MSKIAINNEIVLMRQAVRQARVIVVRKLIKEAKLLQARKHGDEKTREKCKRKAQRLVAEIAAAKKIKDDEISKFGITNTRKLEETLSDVNCEAANRIMSRLAFHKILEDRITKFKEKFPDYEQHLGPGRKKLSKLQRQANREARNAMKRNSGKDLDANEAIFDKTETSKNEIVNENLTEHVRESSNEEDDNVDDSEEETEPKDSNNKINEDKMEIVDNKVEENETELAESKINEADNEKAELEESLTTKYHLEPGSILRIKSPSSKSKNKKEENSIRVESNDSIPEKCKRPKNKEESDKPKKIKLTKVASNETTEQALPALKAASEAKKPKPIKVISKEASVKRFSEFMDETKTEEIVQEPDTSTITKKRDTKIEKEVDSFFMTENGESEYLSVVVPRSKLCEDEEQDDRFSQNHAAKRQKNFHERNNKFFSKIDKRSSSNSHGDKYGSNSGRQRSNNFSNGSDRPEKFGRTGNGPARKARAEIGKKIEVKEEVLHPSWAARKKQQEISKQGFQGKKIVFDY